MAKFKTEEHRLLSFLARRRAELEWPCRNMTLRVMVEKGLARIEGRYQSYWGQGEHDCASVGITDAGRRALHNYEHT